MIVSKRFSSSSLQTELQTERLEPLRPASIRLTFPSYPLPPSVTSSLSLPPLWCFSFCCRFPELQKEGERGGRNRQRRWLSASCLPLPNPTTPSPQVKICVLSLRARKAFQRGGEQSGALTCDWNSLKAHRLCQKMAPL